ncbi:MAG TPA: site-specific integrase [Bryobacteraceae bacterium]|nr:site-specific integrase [Bryobacteraceae bacterium]
MTEDKARRGQRKRHRSNGEGSPYETSDGWRAALVVGWIGDKPKRKFYRGKTKAEVLKKLDDDRRDHRLGILREAPERQTLEQYLASWLKDVATPRVRPKTLGHYQGLIDKHIVPVIGRVPLVKLSPQHVQMLIAEKLETLSPKTCRHIRTCLRVALGTAVKWNLIHRNAAALSDPPPLPERRVRSLTEEELAAFEKAAQGHPFEAAFVLALATGAREGEILGLQWSRVDLEKKQFEIAVQLQRLYRKPAAKPTTASGIEDTEPRTALVLSTPKTRKSTRTVLLCEVAVKALVAHRMRQEADKRLASTRWQDLDFVFANPCTGTPLDPRTLIKYFYQVRDGAGIKDLRFHDLRHSCASFLLAHGVPIKMISELLGHSSTAFTMDVYGHVLPKLQQQAATEMDAIFEAARKAQQDREAKEKAARGAATGAAGGENEPKSTVVN